MLGHAGAVPCVVGINDATGLNSNTTPNVPFTLGAPLHNQGAAEPGWTTPWQSTRALVQSEIVSEGDGAAALAPLDGVVRSFEPRTGTVTIDQYVRMTPGARMVVYQMQSSPPAGSIAGFQLCRRPRC